MKKTNWFGCFVSTERQENDEITARLEVEDKLVHAPEVNLETLDPSHLKDS